MSLILNCQEWSAGRDLHPQPSGLESDALQLSYPRNFVGGGAGIRTPQQRHALSQPTKLKC